MPNDTQSQPLPACPWWCTDNPVEHPWETNPDGTHARTHGREVGGFHVHLTERHGPAGTSFDAPDVSATWESFDSATDAEDLALDLRQVAVVLREVADAGDKPPRRRQPEH